MLVGFFHHLRGKRRFLSKMLEGASPIVITFQYRTTLQHTFIMVLLKMKLCFLTSLLAAAVGANATNRTSPIVDYRFSCGSDGNSRIDSHSSLGDLVGINSTRCNYVTNGVSSNTVVESNSTIAAMRNEFLETNASGLAVELWITPTVERASSVPRPILTIGGLHYQDDYDDYNACRNEELYIGLRANLLEIRYVDNDPRLSCRILMVRQQPLRNNELVQIVLTLNQGETNLYINGEPIIVGAPNYFMTNLTMWNPESTLQLFSNQFVTPTQAFTGTLHQVSMYDQIVTHDQIRMAYQQGLLGKQDALVERAPLQLVALEASSTVIQGKTTAFYVGGHNRSTAEYVVQLEITSLPRYGKILGDQGPIRAVGTRISLPGTRKKTSLFYRSWSDELFTSPGFSYSGKDLRATPEVFEYRLVAIDRNDGALLGWSDTVRKEINIRHVNQPPALVIPKMVTVPAKQPTSVGARPIATIQDVHLEDSDRNVDRVRVDIWTFNGTVALGNYHEQADFTPRTNRSRPYWQCHGDPKGSRNMTFLAEPDSVSLILSSVQYEGFHWNQEDSIVIRIYDGNDGPCLEEDEHKYNSIHNGCYEIVATMSIPAIAQTPRKFNIRNVSMLQISFWLLCLVPLMACCCVIQCFCKCTKGFCRRSTKGGEIDFGGSGDGGSASEVLDKESDDVESASEVLDRESDDVEQGAIEAIE